MNKQELLELASWGVRRKLRALEVQLADIFKEFPSLFLGEAPPLFLRPEPRGASSNGHWPTLTVTPPEGEDEDEDEGHAKRSAAARSAWTPERRAKWSRHMKGRARKKRRGLTSPDTPVKAVAKRGTAKRGRSAAPTIDLSTYRHIHDYLTLHPGSRLQDVTTAIKAKHPANVLSRLKVGMKRGFYTKKKGAYYAAGEVSAAAPVEG